jgi:cysteine desulfurase
MSSPIYLDYNATTPHDPEVVEAMLPFLKSEFGNPSSGHKYGAAPRKAVQTARQQVADLLGCGPREIVFTSGGTESNNHAIKGIAAALRDRGKHIITSSVEHPSVLQVCRHLETRGYEVTYLPVDGHGLVSVAEVEKALQPDTVLISVMHANNEVGTIQPIPEIAELARANDILLHTDAAQSVGKVPVDVDRLGVHLLTVAGHKLYAPKGVGALYVQSGIRPVKFMHGGAQESGMRAGTENVLEIVGLGKACEIAARDMSRNLEAMESTRDWLLRSICSGLSAVRRNGHPERALPNTLSLSFQGLDAGGILDGIGAEVAASAGAACHAGELRISHVLEAMGVPEDWARGTLRLSTGKMTTLDNAEKAARAVIDAVGALR